MAMKISASIRTQSSHKMDVSASSRREIVVGIALFSILLVSAIPLCAQWNAPTGFPIDWSSSHVVYPPTHSYAEWLAVHQDPRAQYQEMVRNNRITAMSASVNTHFTSAFRWVPVKAAKKKKSSLTADWTISLGTGAMAQNMSPAKFSFATGGTPSCSD